MHGFGTDKGGEGVQILENLADVIRTCPQGRRRSRSPPEEGRARFLTEIFHGAAAENTGSNTVYIAADSETDGEASPFLPVEILCYDEAKVGCIPSPPRSIHPAAETNEAALIISLSVPLQKQCLSFSSRPVSLSDKMNYTEGFVSCFFVSSSSLSW